MAQLKDLIVNGASRFIGKAYGAFVGSFSGNLDGNATTSTTANTAKACSGNSATATKLQTARSLNLGGAVTADAATFDGTANATINVKTLDATKLKGTASVSTTGNAATATKLATPRTLSLTGKATGSATFDGSANAAINVKSVNADTASKLSTARKINITGNATGAATFDGSGDINISTTVNESKHAAAATKLQTSRTLSLSGKAAGSTTFDGAANAAINVTSVNADTAVADSNGVNIAANYVKKSVRLTTENLNDIHTPGLYFCGVDVSATTDQNYPTGRASAIIVMKDGANGDDSCTQLCMPYVGNGIYKRQYDPIAYKWSTWRSVAFTDSNVASASKLAAARTISLTGNASGSASFDGSGDVSINASVNYAAAADTLKSSPATETSTVARPVWLSWEGDNTKQTVSPNLTYTCSTKTLTATNFKGHLAGNADSAATATTADSLKETLDRPASANVTYNDGKIRYFLATSSMSEGKPSGGDGPVIHLSWDRPLWESQITINSPSGHIQTRAQDFGTWGSWKTVLDSDNFNNYAPTKTGGGASGTWGISITGNANTASSVAWSGVTGKPGTYPPSAHNHDSAYPSVTGTRASGTWGINISGTATKATQDASGNVIADTYATKAALSTKQEKLTFDTTPTKGSTNPVTSNGVKAYVDQAIASIVNADNKSY